MTLPSLPRWQPRAQGCAPALQDWLYERGSLTARLQQLAAERGVTFRVVVLRQQWLKPRQDEVRALGIPAHELVRVREVLLCGGDEAWVFARSVLPRRALTGRLRILRQLDNRPLGALLFSNPAITRGPIEVARWPAALLPAGLAHIPTTLWARRSLFRHRHPQQHGILVAEIFLPALRATA